MADTRSAPLITDKRILEEAAAWGIAKKGGAMSDADEEKFAAWLDADPAHRRAFSEGERIWSEIDSLQDFAAAELRDIEREEREEAILRRRRGLRLGWLSPAGFRIAATVASGMLIATALYIVVELRFKPDYETEIAEIEDVRLADGTSITLGPKTALSSAYSTSERRVVLSGGEAYFDVAHDETRPFIVEHEHAIVRVVGTRFNVRGGRSGVTVSVEEGGVEVSLAKQTLDRAHDVAAPASSRYLCVGQRVTATADQVLSDIEDVPVTQLGSWRDGIIHVDDWSLSELVIYLRRYSARKIKIESDAVGDLTVFGAFRTDQIDQALEDISYVLPVEVDRRNPRQVVLRLSEAGVGAHET